MQYYLTFKKAITCNSYLRGLRFAIYRSIVHLPKEKTNAIQLRIPMYLSIMVKPQKDEITEIASAY